MMRVFRGEKTTWYDLEQPSREDIEALRKELNIHSLVMEELIPPLHRPKLDLYPNHLFLVLHVPSVRGDKEGVTVAELDCIISPLWLVTNHYRDIPVISRLREGLEERSESQKILNKPVTPLLYQILSSIMQEAFVALDRIEERIEKIEGTMFTGQERHMVLAISQLRRDIIDFRRITSPARPVFRALDDAGPALLGQDTLPYFRNLTGRSEQMATLLKAQKETVEALEETNQALLTTHTNDIFRMLTVFASVALPLTFIASLFGMNVAFPKIVNLWTVLLGMGLVGAGMLWFFKKKGWL